MQSVCLCHGCKAPELGESAATGGTRRCPREWKEPFHAVAGERPEFFPRTLVEVIRAHASAMAVVGTAEEKESLAFSFMEGYQRTMTEEQHKSRLSRNWCPAPSFCRVQHFPYISG